MLTAGFFVSSAYASEDATPAQKATVVKKAAVAKKPVKKAAAPTVEEQIEKLRTELEGQINGLKNNLSEKDMQLKKAQEAAAEAQAAAAKAQQAAGMQEEAAAKNAAAVSTLQSTVNDLKGNQASLASTVSDETAKIKKAIDSPSTFHFKGVTLTPYGFFNGESVYRAHATGGEMPTAFSSIPYEQADAYALSEMYIGGRQSRVGFTAEGKTSWGVMRAIFEGDFLGVGTTSNDNQSTSYVFRQRIALAEVETKGWTVSAGQGWSLLAESKKGISTAASSIALPAQIDPNYVTGLVWARAGNIRLTKSFKNAALAISAENPQLLYGGSIAGNTPYTVVGSAGLGGGLLNQAISGCSPSTVITNYTNQTIGTVGATWTPVYTTVNACTNLANITFNQAPDMVFKAVIDPKFGHFEVFGVGRVFHQTIYPGETNNAYLYGGLTDINTGTVLTLAKSMSGSYKNSEAFGGVGASGRVNLLANKLVLGAKGLMGPGVGHFGDSTLSDATTDQTGELKALHNASGLLTVEVNPNPRLQLYLYYGGDYAGRADYALAPNGSGGFAVTQSIALSFCTIPGTASTCTTSPTAAQLATAGGKWGPHYTLNTAPVAVGYGSRYLSNSGCNALASIGYNGAGSTAYLPGGSCGAQTRDTQEVTGGYWYDIYRGPMGRLRQGVQYAYAVREGWSGASGIGAKGIENMVFTSFRWFLP